MALHALRCGVAASAAAVVLCTAAIDESAACSTGASCEAGDAEVDNLKVSLLQKKGGDRSDADLLRRRNELLAELDDLERVEGSWSACGEIKDYACRKDVEWAKHEGLRSHPQWYKGLKPGATCTEIQAYLASRNQGHCQAPAAPADDAPAPPPSEPVPSAPAQSGSLPMGHPKAGKQYPQHEHFTLWLVEEFDEPIDLDNDPIWTWGDGAMSQVRFVKENIKFEHGKMKILVNHNKGHQQSCSHSFAEHIKHTPLLSGEFRTKHNMFRYGRYEMAHKAPMVQKGNSHVNGNYISTMFTYRDLNQHHWREIDWEITADSPHSITTNMLQADNTIKWRPDIQKSTHNTYNWVNSREDFNEYAFEWLPYKVTWYINGKKVREQRGKIPELSTKIMMNLWVFEAPIFAFGGKHGSNNRYPLESEYDWFRFYRWNGEKHYPCDNFADTCLTSEDKYLSGNNPCDGIKMVGHHPGQCIADRSQCR